MHHLARLGAAPPGGVLRVSRRVTHLTFLAFKT